MYDMTILRAALLLVGTCLLVSSCSPKLIVRHEDPAIDFVEVRVDGEREAFIGVGDTYRSRVPRGWHKVETYPEGRQRNPWAPDGEGWMLYIDRRGEVTLLPSLAQ